MSRKQSRPDVARSTPLPTVQVATAIICNEKLSPTARTLYAILATKADGRTRETQGTFRSVLAETLGKSLDTVDRALRELMDAGVIAVLQQRDSVGDLTASVYVLHDGDFAQEGSRKDAATQNGHDDVSAGKGGRTSAARGSRKDAGTRTSAATPEGVDGVANDDIAGKGGRNHAGSRTSAAISTSVSSYVVEEPSSFGLVAPDGAADNVSKLDTSRGTRLPADWTPSQALIDWTRGNHPGIGWPEVARFRDYWTAQPGQRGRKTDWDATWRNWCRKASEGTPTARTAASTRNPAIPEGW